MKNKLEKKVINKLVVADGFDVELGQSMIIPASRDITELILLEITRPGNGAYLMEIKTAGIDVRKNCSLETTELIGEELFEAFLVFGHTLTQAKGSHEITDYQKEIINHAMKTFRARQEEDRKNAN